jgi:hypothetical protein
MNERWDRGENIQLVSLVGSEDGNEMKFMTFSLVVNEAES